VNLLQRHLFWQALVSCLASAGLLTLLLILANALKDLVPLLADGRIDLLIFLKSLALLAPFVATYALPAGVLVGTLLLLGRLSAQSEITAMRSAGLSLRQVAAPIVFLGLLGVAASAVVNFHYGPSARGIYRRELAESIRTNPQSFLVQRTFIREFPGYVLYFGEREGGRLGDVWVWVVDGQRRVTQYIRAREARLVFDEAAFAFTLSLRDAQAELRDPADPERVDEPPYVPSAGEITLQLPLDRLLGGGTNQRVSLSWMTLSQLREARSSALEREERARAAGQGVAEAHRQRVRVQMVLQERLAAAFSVLSFALLAVPLGIKVRRKETSANLGVALALALSYYLLSIFIGWLDKQPQLRTDLLVWLPNLAFQIAGIWMLRRMD
jgi:lipopolysaccharide export system permease protein